MTCESTRTTELFVVFRKRSALPGEEATAPRMLYRRDQLPANNKTLEGIGDWTWEPCRRWSGAVSWPTF